MKNKNQEVNINPCNNLTYYKNKFEKILLRIIILKVAE